MRKRVRNRHIILVFIAFVCGIVFAFYYFASTEQATQSSSSTSGQQGANKDETRGEDVDLNKLNALPYLQSYHSAPSKSGVTRYDSQSAYNGFNLVVSGHSATAYIMDMNGKVLHKWHKPFKEIWSGKLDFEEDAEHKKYWRRCYLFKNGDLLAIFEGIGIIKLDKDSNLIWANKCRAHHDLYVDEKGRIHTLTRRLTSEHGIPGIGPSLEDFIAVMSPGGKIVSEVSLLDCFRRSNYVHFLDYVNNSGDLFHTNTIELLDKRASKVPGFKPGQLLLSLCRINTIAVVDMKMKKVTWALKGTWKSQHQPTLLDNGNILLFDNHWRKKEKRSRVIEIVPRTGKIAWTYKSDGFYSRNCSSVQRLPNGNTLVTETEKGRAFEVTPDKKIVWEYINTHRVGDKNDNIATLLEVIRYSKDSLHCSAGENGSCF